MSSDYFDDESISPEVFEELDAIEAAYFSPSKLPPPRRLQSVSHQSSSDGFGFDIDESELARLDKLIEDEYNAESVPAPGRTNIGLGAPSMQTNLFGEVIPSSSTSKSQKVAPPKRVERTQPTSRNPFGQQARKTKVWDHTEYAKTGFKRTKSKGKEKQKGVFTDEYEECDEPEEFEQFPAPLMLPVGPPPPMKLVPDLLEAKHWIFPLNQPKRDYQFNIVKHCLFENTLVALPTGLGKTFIAGCVMLNFYRWFPEGKIVFVAPTKPLVAQQIDACHKTCGIPGSHAVELTGQNPRAMRSRAWIEKRIFYMTPQTLINDLSTENCDARQIVLLVIDEAHKGTGDYAYAQVIRFLMARNPHFRVLALTATPGGTPDAVQAIVDSLHISRIEIRDEASLDLKDYIHHKIVKQHIIRMSDDVDRAQNILLKLMEATARPLRDRGVMYTHGNLAHISAFLPQSIMRSLDKSSGWAYAPLAKLSSLARAMGYLLEGTMQMCYTYLQEIADDSVGGDEKKIAKAARLKADPTFQALMKELETQHFRGFSAHPKMDMLKGLVLQHFGERMGEAEDADATRVMVFVTFRAAVEEIVEVLNTEQPLIRATKFIGQGTDKQGKKGFAQKEQLDVLRRFKAGEFNVLVATSIGEEGLDIGEIDMIVCYDAQKTPIRMLQRLGRTGRKRDGYVHVLLAEGREEMNMDKAKATYKEVQKTIVQGEQLELFSDVPRLLPDHIKPQCLERKMDIEEYVREEPGQRRRKASSIDGQSPSPKKRKRNDDVGRNIPAGASKGFVTVRDLLHKGKARDKGDASKKRRVAEFDEALAEDDEVDQEIEESLGVLRSGAGEGGNAGARKASRDAAKEGKLSKATTAGKKQKRKRSVPPVLEPTPSQCADDSDDLDIERGIVDTRLAHLSPSPKHGKASPKRSPIAKTDVIDLSSDSDSQVHSPGCSKPSPKRDRDPGSSPLGSCGPRLGRPANRTLTHPQTPTDRKHDQQSMAWLVDEDEDPDFELVNSSPAPHTIRSRDLTHPHESSDVEIIQDPLPRSRVHSRPRRQQHSPECIDSSPAPNPVLSPGARTHPQSHASPSRQAQQTCRSPFAEPPKTGPLLRSSSPLSVWSASAQAQNSSPRREVTAAHSRPTQTPRDSNDSPVSSQPVRPPKRKIGKPDISPSNLMSSPSVVPPPAGPRRLQRRQSPSPSPVPKKVSLKPKKRKVPVDVRRHDPWIDHEAVHSGDEVSEGSSQVDEVETESDRRFLEAPPETQVSPSYDQTLAYRQSLLTQPPLTGRAPVFANRPVRRGIFRIGGIASTSRRRFAAFSSSPPREDDRYVFDSFVVDDDAEVLYTGPSSDI